MPCMLCNNGLWKWGLRGRCKYRSERECEEDNKNSKEDMRRDKREFSKAGYKPPLMKGSRR